ncbi:MAG: response regulator [Pseudomonadota bacterium]|nr:response regulator [Pseudomonadota bacterium]
MIPRILVVDDEVDIPDLFRQRFRRELKAGAVELAFAANGLEAIACLQAGPPFDMILTDVNMPELDGLQLLDRVRQDWPTVPVVLVSAYSGQTNRERALSLGARDFVAKPVDFRHLKTLVSDVSNPTG